MRRMPGKQKPLRISLGRYPEIGLAQARAARNRRIGDLVSGVHPESASSRAKANTFAALGEQFLSPPCRRRRRTPSEIGKAIGRHIMPRWGSRGRLSKSERRDVIAMLGASDAGAGPYMAAKALALASGIYRFGITRELVANNPAPHQDHRLRRRNGPAPACPDRFEIALVWQAPRAKPHGIESTYTRRPFARLLLLTAVRRSEAARHELGRGRLRQRLWVSRRAAPRAAPRMRFHSPAWLWTCSVAAPLHRWRFVFSTTGGRAPIQGFGTFKDNRYKSRRAGAARAVKLAVS